MAGKAGMERKREFGHIDPVKTRNGNRYKGYYPDPNTGKRTYLGTYRTKAEANAALSELQTSIGKGTYIDKGRAAQTFEEISQLWLESDPDKRGNSLSQDRLALENWIVPAIGHRKIGTVTTYMLQELVNRWADGTAPHREGSRASTEPPKASTLQRRFATLTAVFAFAALHKWIPSSPCQGVKLPKAKKGRRKVVLTDGQVRAIADATRDEYGAFMWTAALTGCRWSEVAALRVNDIDTDAGTVRVDEAVSRTGSEVEVYDDTKTAAGRREIPIPPALVTLLEKRMGALDTLGLNASDQLLWPRKTDPTQPQRYDVCRNRVWLPAVKAAGLEDLSPTFHDLRRAYASALVQAGTDPKTTQTLLGHEDIRTTLDLYASPSPETKRAATAAVAERYLPEESSGSLIPD